MNHIRLTRKMQSLVLLIVGAPSLAPAADDTAARLGRAAAVLNTMIDSTRGIRAEQIAASDCVAVIPGFKKAAAVVGVGYGRGFISCRTNAGWSAPGAVI